MGRKFALLLSLALMLALFAIAMPTRAQDGANAWTTIETNLRTGPGRNYPVITQLPVNLPLVLEARSATNEWILIHSTDNTRRGWVASKLVRVADGVRVANLNISTEEVAAPAAPTAAPANNAGSGTTGTTISTAPVTSPYVPKITGAIRSAMRAVLAKGKRLGNNPRVFSKIGDCQTDHWAFMKVFGWKQYDLGQYGYLQGIIDYYSVPPRENTASSFDIQSLASSNGFNSSAVLETAFADPNLCQKDESPLECEYRVNKPAVAIIMFGTSDVIVMEAYQYREFMTDIITKSLEHGVIPVLSTFPENPGYLERSRQINQVVKELAAKYRLPMMNLAAAVKDLPGMGLEPDAIHLTLPPEDKAGYFTPENLQYGYTMRNLIVLQTLDAVYKGILR